MDAQRLYALGRASWPGIELNEADFQAVLSGHLAANVELRAGDLYLCCACSMGVPAALKAFDEQFLSKVPQFLRHKRAQPAFVEDVQQTLREKLLLRKDDAPPGILRYNGQGTLQSWLRVVALRTATNLRRNKDEQVEDHSRGTDLDRLQVIHGWEGADAEAGLIKGFDKRLLTEALKDAFAALKSEQRNLLRLYYVRELTTTEIGTLFQVNSSTVTRWLKQTRTEILKSLRRVLLEKQKVSPQS